MVDVAFQLQVFEHRAQYLKALIHQCNKDKIGLSLTI